MNGFAIILLGLIAFGVLHIKSTSFMAWQWYVAPRISEARVCFTDVRLRLMIIFGVITLIVSVLFWYVALAAVLPRQCSVPDPALAPGSSSLILLLRPGS